MEPPSRARRRSQRQSLRGSPSERGGRSRLKAKPLDGHALPPSDGPEVGEIERIPTGAWVTS